MFARQKWYEFSKSDSQDIVVHWPDGLQTKGLLARIDVHAVTSAHEWTSFSG